MNSFASNGADKEKGIQNRLPGFIFLCNSSTIIHCYKYGVFGLPKGRMKAVKAIGPGTKLFLFDFESKVLFGIYEAISTGKLNLEPAAFGGRFPAQVKFKIDKDVSPLDESCFRLAIKENYKGSKFKQELSEKQVTKLSSLFCPLPETELPPPSPYVQIKSEHIHDMLKSSLHLCKLSLNILKACTQEKKEDEVNERLNNSI